MEQTIIENKEPASLSENDPLQKYPAVEVNISMPNDNSITVFEGLPELTKQNTTLIPYKPHIFRADNITVYQEINGKPERLELEDKVVLVMHGELRRNNIYPKSSGDNPSGVQYYSIEEIIKGYESKTGTYIDILVVCSGETTAPQNLDHTAIYRQSFSNTGKTPFVNLTDKIHTVCEQASATITKNPDSGKVSLNLSTPSRDFMFIPEKYKE